MGSDTTPAGPGQVAVRIDGSRLGGYTRAICLDLFRIAQFRPGDPVRFRVVDPDEAHDPYVECGALGGGAELA